MLMLLTALATAPAMAGKTEVGTNKKVGIGATVGSPHAFTAKWYLNPNAGIALFVGVRPLWGGAVRVSYQQDFWNIGNWSWGKLDMGWQAGVIAWGGLGNPLLPGAGGGVGAHLRFKSVPAEVFVDHAAYVYPTGFWSDARGVGYVGSLGGRWYF